MVKEYYHAFWSRNTITHFGFGVLPLIITFVQRAWPQKVLILVRLHKY